MREGVRPRAISSERGVHGPEQQSYDAPMRRRHPRKGGSMSDYRDWDYQDMRDAEIEGWRQRYEALIKHLAEQPAQQEPVAWMDEQLQMLNFLYGSGDFDGVWFDQKHPAEKGAFWWRKHLRRLFTSPPASKPWEGLTQEDMYEIGEFKNTHGYVPTGFKRLAAAIEAKLREKNTPQQSKGDA